MQRPLSQSDEASFEIWTKSVHHPPTRDYTFEERHVRGHHRPSLPEQDKVCCQCLNVDFNHVWLLHFDILRF